jgi:hypothetical protein
VLAQNELRTELARNVTFGIEHKDLAQDIIEKYTGMKVKKKPKMSQR